LCLLAVPNVDNLVTSDQVASAAADASALLSSATSSAMEATSAAQEATAAAAAAALSAASEAQQETVEAITTAASAVTAAASDVTAAVSGTISGALGVASDTFGGVASTVGEATSVVTSSVSSTASTVTAAAEGALASVNSAATGLQASVGAATLNTAASAQAAAGELFSQLPTEMQTLLLAAPRQVAAAAHFVGDYPLQLSLGVAAVAVPLTVQYLKARYGGYAGELDPVVAYDTLLNDEALLVDIRTAAERQAGGLPELKYAARFKATVWEPLELEPEVIKR
jgi:hypothetical protein